MNVRDPSLAGGVRHSVAHSGEAEKCAKGNSGFWGESATLSALRLEGESPEVSGSRRAT